jgi:hypothetical protein
MLQICNEIPNGHEIEQKCPFHGLPKCTQIGIFGVKIYHLATLLFESRSLQNVSEFWREKVKDGQVAENG